MGKTDRTTAGERLDITMWCDAVLNGDVVSFHNEKAIASDMERLIVHLEATLAALQEPSRRACEGQVGKIDYVDCNCWTCRARAALQEVDNRRIQRQWGDDSTPDASFTGWLVSRRPGPKW
jgi:hypothetical protein